MSTNRLFNRPPRLREVIEPVEIQLPQAPSAPRTYPRTPLFRLIVIAMLPALLPPAVLGAVTYFIGAPSSTVITAAALAGAMGLAITMTTLLSRRDEDSRLRAERRECERESAEFDAQVEAHASDAERAVRRESFILERQFPRPNDLVRQAVALTSSLWERRADDDDFMELRLGIGRRRSCVRFTNRPARSTAPSVAAMVDQHEHLKQAPITVPFAPGCRAGMCGDVPALSSMAGWLLMQAAVFHAPGDLVIAVFSRDENLCAWAKWLPHCRLERADDTSWLVGRTGDEATRALRSIADEIASRPAPDQGPRYFIVADGRSWGSLVGRIARWLPDAGAAVSVLQIKSTYQELSGECDFVIELGDAAGSLARRVERDKPASFMPDVLGDEAALEAALALSPLRVKDAAGTGVIPSSVRLADLLPASAEANDVIETWSRTRQAFRLAAPVGAGPDGATVEIDFRRDGPHALLAGTTGSGKSEFLQSLVVSLATLIPPDLLNFLLIDYKGGSAFREVAALPHVVGVVTDLDERLSARALTSLRAEMRRRERLLAAAEPAAANIIEYQSRPRPVPLANLLILIDEFHRLVSEVPDFVDQMVQIAQQGRSLGVHLLLSTQKPSGVVSEFIRANTNLRLSLRVTDEADSRDVLGSAEAAHIPRHLPGRTFVRRGHESLEACQTGRISGLVPARLPGGQTILAAPFLPPLAGVSVRHRGITATAARVAPAGPADDGAAAARPMVDERDQVVRGLVSAAAQAGFPVQEPPWQPHLPGEIPLSALDHVPATDGRDASIAIGIIDEPELQRQGPFVIDLESGHVCVAGGANTGKTTALLAIAEAAGMRFSERELHIYGIDYAGGGLAALALMPHCGGVAAQHEPARVTWITRTLKDLVAERLAGAAQEGARLPRILIVVDNFNGFYAALQNTEDGIDAADDLYELLDVGRSVGVTFAVSVERPDAVRASVMALMQTRVAFPFPDAESSSAFGLQRALRAAETIPGRALIPGHVIHEAQIALPDVDERYGKRQSAQASEGGPMRIAPLPSEAPYDNADATNRARAVPPVLRLGIEESLTPVFEFPAGEHLLVLGPRGSGRSNALAVAVSELRASGVSQFYIVNPRRSQALKQFAAGEETMRYAERASDLAALWDELTNRVRASFEAYDGDAGGTPDRWAVIIDDADLSELPPDVADALQQLVLRGSDIGAVLAVAADTQGIRTTYPSGPLRALMNMRTGILLRPATPEDFDLFGVRGRPARLPAGRGYYCAAGTKHAVQLFHHVP